MKKKILINQITYHCISCDQDYQTFSMSAKNTQIPNCRNCNPFYTGTSGGDIRVGAVEKYRQRANKVKGLKNTKNNLRT